MSNAHEHCVAQAFEDSPPKVLERLRYHVFVCTDGKDFCGCEAGGSPQLVVAMRQELAKRRLMAQVKINIMQCRQPGARGPVLVVHPDGIWYEGVTPADVPELVERQIVGGEPVERLVMKGGPKPVTAVPSHIAAEGEDCCATKLTPEERAQAS